MRVRGWLLVVGLVALHLFLRVTYEVDEWAPDLLLVAALAVSRHRRATFAAVFGMLVGVIDDSFAARSFGASMVALSATSAMGSFSTSFFVGHPWHFPFLYFGLGKVVRDLLGWVLSDPVVRTPFAEPMALELLRAALLAAAVGFVVSFLIPVNQQPPRRR